MLLEERPPKDGTHGEKIVLVKFKREMRRIPVYDFCTAKNRMRSLSLSARLCVQIASF